MSLLNKAVSIYNHPYLNGAAVPAIFGNGYLGTAVNGIQRIPAMMATCTAVLILGELTLRKLTAGLQRIGLDVKPDTWVGKRCAQITGTGLRPYQDQTQYPTSDLFRKFGKVAVIGIIATEFVRITGGPVPPIYNNVLSFFGPIRISSESYISGVSNVIKNFRS